MPAVRFWAAAVGSGATSRIARRHSPASSLVSLRIFHQHDMQPARPVRAELDTLLDVAGARRPGNQIDRARPALRPPSARSRSRSQPSS